MEAMLDSETELRAFLISGEESQLPTTGQRSSWRRRSR